MRDIDKVEVITRNKLRFLLDERYEHLFLIKYKPSFFSLDSYYDDTLARLDERIGLFSLRFSFIRRIFLGARRVIKEKMHERWVLSSDELEFLCSEFDLGGESKKLITIINELLGEGEGEFVQISDEGEYLFLRYIAPNLSENKP